MFHICEVIGFCGHKSGICCEGSDFIHRFSIEVEQASQLTMRIQFKDIRNALPVCKCCREHYSLNGTFFANRYE